MRFPSAVAVARVAVALVAVAGLAFLVSACGGSSGEQVAQLGSTTAETTSSAGRPAASTRVSAAVRYAHCMRSNGVSNWPDPESNGVFDKSQLTPARLGVSGSRLQAAQNACRHLLPNGGSGPGPVQIQQVRAQALRFSRCVRAHGVPDFPDPDDTGRIPDPATVGIDQGSPRFEAANRACGRYRPGYMPSNAAYNAYARSHGG